MSQPYGPSIPKNTEDSGKRAVIGPALPPHLLKQNLLNEDTSPNTSSEEEEEIQAQKDANIKSTGSENAQPHIEENYGPALPPHLQKVLPKVVNNDDSDEDYGPLPAGISSKSPAQIALEERALQLKLALLKGTGDTQSEVRETWMLELPEVGGAHLGLGPRQFRKNNRPDFSDRSSWTDTPEQKANKSLGKQEIPVDLKKEAELREIAKSTKEKDKLVADYNKKKKRDKSLLALHQEKIKKQKMDEHDASTSRRPFNREIDLKISQFDPVQKKSILNKAMHLDDRFSRGESKYL